MPHSTANVESKQWFGVRGYETQTGPVTFSNCLHLQQSVSPQWPAKCPGKFASRMCEQQFSLAPYFQHLVLRGRVLLKTEVPFSYHSLKEELAWTELEWSKQQELWMDGVKEDGVQVCWQVTCSILTAWRHQSTSTSPLSISESINLSVVHPTQASATTFLNLTCSLKSINIP